MLLLINLQKPQQQRLFDLILRYWQSFMIFQLLIWTVAQTPIRHIIFWKTVIKNFISMYVNCFNTLTFLAEISTKLKKICTFLYNLKTITQKGSMETRQMTPFFIYFFCSVCNIHFFYLKMVKIYFLMVSPLVYSGLQNTSVLCKRHRFGQPIIFF